MGTLYAQEDYGIKTPDTQIFEQMDCCGRFATIWRNRSKEISMGVRQEKDRKLYLYLNNKEWFLNLFKNPKDGLAVDVVTKDMFDCDLAVLPKEIRGHVLKPLYTQDILPNVEQVQKGYYRLLVGTLPKTYHHKELEFNMLLINNNYLCNYYTTFSLQSFNFELLDTGLYLDSIQYRPKEWDKGFKEGTLRSEKVLRFQIPFKKNVNTFSAQDIKPLYDSLQLTDYDIKRIEITAYSSIEGSIEANAALQKQRANSIINALQTFQKPTIQTVVTTSENWVDFLNDIKGTPHDSLRFLSKSAIRQKLTEPGFSDMEYYLQHHRKALVNLYLDKVDAFTELSGEQLLQEFNTALLADELGKAEEIQYTLFRRMRNTEIDPNLLRQMEIPKQRRFVEFFNANSAFRYQMNQQDMFSTYYELQRLDSLMPNNKKVVYNLTALKLRMNHALRLMPDKAQLLKQIAQLRQLDLDEGLRQRLLVNLHIITAELLMREGDYDGKDESVAFILQAYTKIPLSDRDYLSLAQFVTYYYDRETAITLLRDKVNDIAVDKRLLFYYLNLTLIDETYTNDPDYRTIMLNAINLDQERFCGIFDSSEEGGVTFQLLKNAYLRDTYCENCGE
ncbi:MAG: hypothetical protein AAGA86_08310 [Bacteroidota bacterium]